PEGRRLVFFPGSTIGNFEPAEARAVLAGFRRGMREGDAVLIGADRVKDEQILVDAYDDAKGVTAAFNLNLLKRIQGELGARLQVNDFSHKSIWNRDLERIEMHLVAERETTIELDGQHYVFKPGESLHTENSHKFTPESFARLAKDAGYQLVKHWSDPAELFSLYWLEPKWEA
ncbi:MAG: L-histidine N(alpha)-methyltransferase, partial [Pseudomonadota bacterium]|nr:L-histidine N(alpha)-methyltransferase [Pseudomonadota bacterium]